MSERPATERRPFRAGDLVKDTASGAIWVVDIDEGADFLVDSTTRIVVSQSYRYGVLPVSKLLLVTATSDESRISHLRRVSSQSHRRESAVAKLILEAIPAITRRTLEDVVLAPPEGWIGHEKINHARFVHRLAEVAVYSPHPVHHPDCVEVAEVLIHDRTLGGLLIAHRAITELLEALSEVSGG